MHVRSARRRIDPHDVPHTAAFRAWPWRSGCCRPKTTSMTNQRLVIVANRLPCRIGEEKGSLQLSPSAGGLVTSMASYLAKNNPTEPTLWVGASDVDEP